jgi:hypothetical protein
MPKKEWILNIDNMTTDDGPQESVHIPNEIKDLVVAQDTFAILNRPMEL